MDTDDATKASEGIERLYRQDGQRLWWALLAWAGDREIANGAVAEAYAQALSRGTELHDPGAWIWKVAFRVAAGELQRRRRTVPLDDTEYEAPQPVVVFDALKELPDRQRAAVVLHHYAGYRLNEIGQILGISKATVGVHLTRGRRRLQKILEANDA